MRESMRYVTIAMGIGLLVMLNGASAQAGTIDPDLEQVLETAGRDEIVRVLVYLKDRVDLAALDAELSAARAPRAARHEVVMRALQDKANTSQALLREQLTALREGGQIERWESFWLVNSLAVDARPEVIYQVATHPDVGTIYRNYPVKPVTPVAVAESPWRRSGPEPGLVAIRATEVWDMGYTGAGLLVSTVDSGVDGTHPALASRWAGVADPRYAGHPEWAWHDAFHCSSFPEDLYGHGTHTMGTVCGGYPGDSIGVAPDAHWIAACNLANSTGQFVDNSIASLQWIADPDGDPTTFWDVPAVCSNSWGLDLYDVDRCDEGFWTFIDACEAVGVVIVFSAGNDGSMGPGRPADRATNEYNACSVGAVDANTPGWPIAFFSARGPSYCTPDGGPAIKPEVAAPGFEVRSSYPGGGYIHASGTSMASPHVNGVVALMLEACPYLTVNEVKQILYDTAVDLGIPGNDNDYGWGMIDALAAVNRALAVCTPRPPFAWDDNFTTEMNAPLTIRLRAMDDGLPDPPGALNFVIVELPESGTLIDPGLDEITDVPHVLAGGVDQVIYRPGPYYRGSDRFTFLANDGGAPPDGGDSNVAEITLTVGLPSLIYDVPLDADPGWSRECEWEFGQPTGQGGQDWGYPDPTCGATGLNVFGVNLNGDYDFHPSGLCCLTTEPLDFTTVRNVTLRFHRWLNIDGMIEAEARIAVSNDGTTWHELWCNGLWMYTDNYWRERDFDISDVADGRAAVQVRWTYKTNPMVERMSGWNIDDIQFWGLPPPTLILGDLDRDADVDLDDLPLFVDALMHAGDPAADLNGDALCDGRDIQRFADALLSRP